ncbi:MAG: ribonuclease PH [Armatimonadetes bacterium]|nr:ribonuclease PH [Armatimonadota bacterium]
MFRIDGRRPDQLRPVTIVRNFIKYAEGSVLVEMGDTRVICTASSEDRVPLFLKGSGTGWVSAEYGMLPRATSTRTQRDSARGGVSGRSQEIQRLVGRSLRSVVDMSGLGERTIWIDCDVIQADGGTRTAAITGALVALADALAVLLDRGTVTRWLLTDFLAAVSVGVVDGVEVLDLNYSEDSKADVDMNLVATGSGKFVEIQGTAERRPFDKVQLDRLLALGDLGIKELLALQKSVLSDILTRVAELRTKA